MTRATCVERLSTQGVRKIYVDGALTIQGFLADGLIDDLTITVIPVLLGTGKPLFAQLSADVRLEHVETITFDFGFVQSRYRVIHNT